MDKGTTADHNRNSLNVSDGTVLNAFPLDSNCMAQAACLKLMADASGGRTVPAPPADTQTYGPKLPAHGTLDNSLKEDLSLVASDAPHPVTAGQTDRDYRLIENTWPSLTLQAVSFVGTLAYTQNPTKPLLAAGLGSIVAKDGYDYYGTSNAVGRSRYASYLTHDALATAGVAAYTVGKMVEPFVEGRARLGISTLKFAGAWAGARGVMDRFVDPYQEDSHFTGSK